MLYSLALPFFLLQKTRMYQARCCVTSSCYSGPMRRESVGGLPSADTTVLYVELPSHTRSHWTLNTLYINCSDWFTVPACTSLIKMLHKSLLREETSRSQGWRKENGLDVMSQDNLEKLKKGGGECLNWTWFTLWDCIHIAWCIITLHLNASLYNSMHGRSYYEPELYSDSCPNDPYLAGQEGTSTLMQVCIWTTLNVPGAGRH